MELIFKTISSSGPDDTDILAFINRNDSDFYPPIASRRNLTDFVQSVYEHKGRYVVCYNDGKMIGLASVYLSHPSFLTYYHYIAVDKEFRHKGIATELYNRVNEICRETGVQRAIVKTWSANEQAQSLFAKNGFFHLDTLEDDRSKGVHTYFFVKCFTEILLQNPPVRLGVTGSNDNFSMGNFIKVLSSMPRTAHNHQAAIPFMAISNPFTAGRGQLLDEATFRQQLDGVLHGMAQAGVSHLLLLDNYKYHFLKNATLPGNIEIIDVATPLHNIVIARDKNCLLVSSDVSASMDFFDIPYIQIPGYKDSRRIKEIIEEIQSGKVSVSYHKHELATIALLNNCNALLLGSVELHNMFGFDKVYNDIEIFDPWIEIALMLQCCRNDVLTAKKEIPNVVN